MNYKIIIATTAILLGVALYAGVHESYQAQIPDAVRAQFQEWKLAQNRLYGSPSEDFYRLSVFYKNLQMINAHNAEGHSYTLGINQFADLTHEEFLAKYTGGVMLPDTENAEESNLSTVGLPASVDWTTKGAVTPVKNQGQCGCCWSFASTGALEGLKAIKGHGLTPLSEQQLIDCSSAYKNKGCNGGNPQQAFTYLEHSGGIETEASYPYQARVGPCRASSSKFVFKIRTYGYSKAYDNNGLQAAVAQQPVTAAIDAHTLHFYKGGILGKSCGLSINHAVLIVGYGGSGSSLYWKVKNSWGAAWGEHGYFRVARRTGTGVGACDINHYPSWPLV